MGNYIIGYVKNPKKGIIVKRFEKQHHTLYIYKRSAINYVRKHYSLFKKPIAILKQLDDEHWIVVGVIE